MELTFEDKKYYIISMTKMPKFGRKQTGESYNYNNV